MLRESDNNREKYITPMMSNVLMYHTETIVLMNLLKHSVVPIKD